ncbi:IclR family transcriptional regulator [Streptomyces beijiangensis]|uniref:IclR family transcriptional regulator n=1 Tax=Streptomyces beijiangensis TaxID=163361 RepID=UPI0027DD28C7|nr:helix-turn-helix domain-containing protein [Streptomyces beijiangensis]
MTQHRRADQHQPAEPEGEHGNPAWSGGRSVLEGAFRLLGALEQAREAGLTWLAAECGLPKTTAYRLLEQLVDLSAVERSPSGYQMGSRIFRLGHGWQPHPGLRAASREPVRRLERATGATVAINVLREGQTLVLNRTCGDRPGELAPGHNGAVWPWYTAAGKVLVAVAPAGLPLDPLPALWHREAAQIRESGLAYDREQILDGVCCVAVPLHGPGHVPVASLCLITDTSHDLDRLADVAQRVGRAISARLTSRSAVRSAERPATRLLS